MSRSKTASAGRPPRAPAATAAGPPGGGAAAGPQVSWRILLPLALVVVLTRLAAAWGLHHAAEDAYITFRYAQNWGQGLGPVYNAGERVWGFSSPLWTALLALASAAHLDLLAAARAFSLCADLVALTLGVRLLAPHSRTAALAYGLFFACFPYAAAMAALGMESNLLWCLLVVAAATLRRSWVGSGLALAALALTRPEGLAAACLLGLWASNPARALGAVLIAASWLGLGLYYGQWIPQSVVAKALTYGVGHLETGRVWVDWLVPTWWGKANLTMEANHLFPLAILFLPGLVAGVPALRAKLRSPLAALVAAGLGMLAAYALLGVTYFYWYLLTPLMAVVMCAGLGLARLGLPRLVWYAALLYAATDWTHFSGVYGNRLDFENAAFGRAADALQADVREHWPPGSARPPRIALEPIGWIGWRTGYHVVDEVGLVSPWVARRRTGEAGWYADLVGRERPDYLLMRAGAYYAGTAYAGVGQPFRSHAERGAVLAGFDPIYPPMGTELDPGDLVILRRRPGR